MTTRQPAAEGAASDVELEISGMTCSSCANRIEKKLNKLDGVTATVNYATDKATVSYLGAVTPDDLIATVEATGYGAALSAPPAANTDGTPSDRDEETAAWWQRLTVSAVLTVPVVLMSMVPLLQFDNWQWLSLTLASPVVVWGALPFHRAAWTNARHGAATMDTLVSVGVTAAYLWSLWSLFFTHAGMPGMKMEFTLLPGADEGGAHIYLEVAAAVTTFIVLGRYLEARAKRSSGAALRALLDMGAKDVAVLRDGSEVRIPCPSSPSVTPSSCDRERRSPPTVSWSPARPPSTHPCSPASLFPSRWHPTTPSSEPPSTREVGSWSARRAWARTPSWRRWRDWSRTRRAARPRSSAWPTGSRACSCRS